MDGEITPAEVKALIEDGADVRVVDIRAPRAFVQGHIPGSENVPFDRLVAAVERFDGDEHVVTVCPHGKSSVQAANLIASYEGVGPDATVQSMAGGLDAWEWEFDFGADDADGESGRPESPF